MVETPITFGIIIPARYGSTRFPGKPLANILGKPMILRTIEAAQKAAPDCGIAVATDDNRIAQVVSGHAEVIMTKATHQTGTDRIAEAVDLLNWDCDVIVNLQGDEPFVTAEQIQALMHPFKSQNTDIATLKKRMQDDELVSNPNVVKVITDKNNRALYFSRSVIPYNRGNTNYPYFRHLGMYAYRKQIVKKLSMLNATLLEETEMLEQLRWMDYGYVVRVIETEHEGPAVDSPEDIKMAEAYMKST